MATKLIDLDPKYAPSEEDDGHLSYRVTGEATTSQEDFWYVQVAAQRAGLSTGEYMLRAAIEKARSEV